MSWLFNRIPKEKVNELVSKFESGDLAGVDAMYQEYRVYPTGICGSCKKEAQITAWTTYAIENIWTNIEPHEQKGQRS